MRLPEIMGITLEAFNVMPGDLDYFLGNRNMGVLYTDSKKRLTIGGDGRMDKRA